MAKKRKCGVLLPVSSLPSKYGIGCFDKKAYEFVDALKEAGQSYWQILPLGPTSYGDSPYQSFSTFAGNPYFISLEELIKEGVITEQQAKIGYVAAYPYAEVISGYPAFLLGVRSVVPDAVMTVRYTNKWNDYRTEKKYAKGLIDEGCVIISQHSDTAGPATACEETAAGTPVYLVSYNQSMEDVAPTTYLTGCKINWEPYMMGAVDAVLNDRVIEKSIKGTVNGNDIGAGFEEDWVQMLELNEITAADGTAEKMQKVIQQFEQGKLDVFRGDYVGADPDDPDDTYDLNQGYTENEFASAPSFHYVLKDVIRIEE